MKNLLTIIFPLTLLLAISGCDNGGTDTQSTGGGGAGGGGGGNRPERVDVTDPSKFPIKGNGYTVLNILTDQADHNRAKQLAEDTINRYPDIDAMVGLWQYNAPQILNAVKEAGKLGEIKIFSFDEDPATLDAIADGNIHSTVAQQSFLFGYKGMEYMAALARGQEIDLPEDKLIWVPVREITKDNVAAFRTDVENILAGEAKSPEAERSYDTSEPVRAIFVTNSVNPFWDFAAEGVKLASEDFNIEGLTIMPPNATVDEQKRMIDEQVAKGVDAVAISPINPENQTGYLNSLAEDLVLITHDSDAPDSNRAFYIGTDNYMAGRTLGKHIKEAMPDGGTLMLFVGKMDVLNAQERSQGLVDELLGIPIRK